MALCAVGIGLGKLQTGARNQGESGFLFNAAHGLIAPLSGLLTSIANSVSDFGNGMAGATALTRRNRELQSMERAASLYGEQVRRLESEIGRLRNLLAMPPVPGKIRVPATIVEYFPVENRATLSVGSTQGVRKNMPVVSAGGLVGVVQTVAKDTCQVLLVSSSQLKLVGMVSRDPAPVGFVRGQSAGAMVWEVFDSKSVVQNGDTVVTSGFSERIPAGIPIGKVIQIEEDVSFGSRRCQLFPGVQVGSVREVFVLR